MVPSSPGFFTTNFMLFDFKEEKQDTPVFDKFLKDLSSGYFDREIYLLAILKLIIETRLEYQVFIYPFPPGASGK